MMEPERLRQGVSYLGFLSKQLGELRGRTTLAHELIQNADDAKDDEGNLSAKRITFDFRDDALIVSNDAVFRKIDFDRLQDVAGGTKRNETGARTTGTFGVGFISVYQVTDRPEIHSAGRRWIIRPEDEEGKPIYQYCDPSITRDQGTVFRFPWAFEESPVREKLKVTPIDKEYIESFIEELRRSLPKTILFLKNVEVVELCQNGELVSRVKRDVEGSDILVDRDGIPRYWQVFKGDFCDKALRLKAQNPEIIEDNRCARVRVAIPDPSIDDGLLFATLPTEQSMGLPFHIDADFFSASDRKSITFDDRYDPKSEWNRAAIEAAACVVAANLNPLRDMFRDDASTFWAILDRLHQVHSEYENDTRKPFAAFWKLLLPALQHSPIVYTESRQWLKPTETRIPTSDKERDAVSAFEALGIEIVHRDLRRYHNILISNGVAQLKVKDIYEALQKRGLIESPQPVPPDFKTHALLKLLWRGIHGVLENTKGQFARHDAEELLRKCVLAPALDGHLWPCGSVYRANDATRDIFANLVADDVTFLAVKGIPSLETLCPLFTVHEAIKQLEERQNSQEFHSLWKSGRFRPRDFLSWFDDQRSKLTPDLRQRLANLQVFPSLRNLRSLNKLYLPGGFDDPIGVAVLLDMGQLEGFSDFLRSLGARELTFQEYAMTYIPAAFDDMSAVSPEDKRSLLKILEKRIGEIKDNEELRNGLAKTNIVECIDGEFRQPRQVYLPNQAVEAVLGNHVSYANLPEESAGRSGLYRWLRVQDRPRPEDVQRRIVELAARPPDPHTRKTMVEVLKALGSEWAKLPDNEQELFSCLKIKEWLPAEDDLTSWYRPDQLHAICNRHLFASQAKFLDVHSGIQRQVSDFLSFLGVNPSPRPFHVVRHLLKCAQDDAEPPKDIYNWLNRNMPDVQSSDFCRLQNSSCLRIEGKYFRPDQVFWGRHPFGQFRFQLGPDFRALQDLLQALGIRETPDYNDAFEVLKDVSKTRQNKPLKFEEENVVLQCWVMLSEALECGDIDSERIRCALQGIKCVPNARKSLQLPSWTFFEDRPGLADKFAKELSANSIKRRERVWVAMEAAGVRPISDAVRGFIVDAVNQREDEDLKERVIERTELIKTIANVTIQLDKIRFIRADELKVKWHLTAFNLKRAGPPESASAHLHSDEMAIYFSSPKGNYPWPGIAREMSQALAPRDNLSSISPGIKIILEADSRVGAISQLNDLGIPLTDELKEIAITGSVAESFEEAPPPAQPHDLPTASQHGPSVGSLPDNTQQVEQNEPAGSDATSGDSEDDTPHPAGSTRPASKAGGAGNGGRPAAIQTPPEATAPEIEPPTSGPTQAEAHEPEGPFAKKIFEAQTATPAAATESPVWITEEGPKTEESAEEHTRASAKVGRSGAHIRKSVARWEPTEAAKDLADKFRGMVESDYVKRCQVCGKTFTKSDGEFQVFVVHFLPPSEDHRSNHFGNLVGLCGWHYAVLKFGVRAWLDPKTGERFDDWTHWRDFVLGASAESDDAGNRYISVPLRFLNVYRGWRSDPETSDREIRYSIPHWTYLCELLKT